jgi:hypothetical protein
MDCVTLPVSKPDSSARTNNSLLVYEKKNWLDQILKYKISYQGMHTPCDKGHIIAASCYDLRVSGQHREPTFTKYLYVHVSTCK